MKPIDILLAEDSEYDAEMTMLALEKNHLKNKIHWVKDGQETLDYLFCQGEYEKRNIKNTPKLVLLDLKMPKIGGIEVLKRIREDKRTKHIPVVVMTSSNEEKDVVDSYELGVNSYVVKPVDFEQFTDVVKQAGYYWVVINMPKN